jgi:hypothetical protein
MYSLMVLAVLLMPVGCLAVHFWLAGASLLDVVWIGSLGAMVLVGIMAIGYSMVMLAVQGLAGQESETVQPTGEDWRPDHTTPGSPRDQGGKLAA